MKRETNPTAALAQVPGHVHLRKAPRDKRTPVLSVQVRDEADGEFKLAGYLTGQSIIKTFQVHQETPRIIRFAKLHYGNDVLIIGSLGSRPTTAWEQIATVSASRHTLFHSADIGRTGSAVHYWSVWRLK